MIRRHHSARFVLAAFLPLLAVFALPATSLAATQPQLGSAQNYTVIAATTITNTGSSVISGNLALSPGSSVTGFPPGVITGTRQVATATAVQAQNDLTSAYLQAAAAPSTMNLSGKDLGGLTLTPGVYTFSSSAALTGAITLNGNGVYIFQIGSTLTSASNASIVLENGAQACAVYWKVGSSATLGRQSHLVGNVMALTSITMDTGASLLDGRALARTGALTLDANQVTAPQGACTVGLSATPTPAPTATPAASATPGAAAGVPATGADPGGTIIPGVLLAALGLITIVVMRRMHLYRL